MKKLKTLFVVALTLILSSAHAQYNTGDRKLDKFLANIDAEAAIDLGAFKAKIGGRYDISSKKLEELSIEVGMRAGDIYISAEIAKSTGRDIDEVVAVYNSNKGKGWGVMAKELGIQPGSAEFHRLKSIAAKNKGAKPMKSKGKSNQKSKKKG